MIYPPIRSEREPEGLAFDRVVFFSDAVWAIVITLLVIELKPPHIESDATVKETVRALVAVIPKLVGYMVSFVVLAMFWLEHHRIFRCLKAINHKALWRNIILLLVVGLVPFPTAFFSENHHNPVALALYAGTLATVGILKMWFWNAAVADSECRTNVVDQAFVKQFKLRTWTVTLVCIGVTIAAIMQIPDAYVGFGLTPLASWLARKLD